ncbi:MAG: alginate export family protein [Planctomycetes bacterium]|nr:alginate export family protein [Planctomycetota bacterium]
MFGTIPLLFALFPQDPSTATLTDLRVGHVIEARGEFDERGRFVAQKLVLLPAKEDDILVGAVRAEDFDPASFTLLGQRVDTDDLTNWNGLDKGSLAGKRVKVEGTYKGPKHFRAESIAPRGEGRDRIGARIDSLVPVEGGLEARLMNFIVVLPDKVEIEHELPLSAYGLAPQRMLGGPDNSADLERDEDDDFGQGIALHETLRLMGQLEWASSFYENFDLLEGSVNDEEDRWDNEEALRFRLAWTPRENLYGVAELRYRQLYRRDEDNGVNDSVVQHDGAFGETWLQWRDLGGNQGLDLTVGRQDFDDPREWLYDQNLDALRLSWIRPAWRLDVSASTTLTSGSERDQESWNAVAYLSNNDNDRNLAVWGLVRESGEAKAEVRNASNNAVEVELADSSLYFGARALGAWLPQNEVWADFSIQIGERDAPVNQGPVNVVVDSFDVSTWAYDIGSTWFPPFAAPLYFTVGYALGQGASNANESYRQTGYQDNNAKFGGVTSFSYYGELFEPELSNLGITTLGVGALVAERTSLDLVHHTYTQDEASAVFSPFPGIEANLDSRPNGNDADLGWELDLIFGYRRFKRWDLEIVAATFEPGAGFDVNDSAYYAKFQVRYRL